MGLGTSRCLACRKNTVEKNTPDDKDYKSLILHQIYKKNRYQKTSVEEEWKMLAEQIKRWQILSQFWQKKNRSTAFTINVCMGNRNCTTFKIIIRS